MLDTNDADVAAISQLLKQYCQAANDSNLDAFMSLWDDNAIRQEPDQPSIHGKEQIYKHFEMTFNEFGGDIEIYGDTEIQVTGPSWAYCRGTFTFDLTPKQGGPVTHLDGKWMDILKKQADGSWKIYRDMINFNAPPTQS
jgi:uncharacterized protein (TIGR02246 family)